VLVWTEELTQRRRMMKMGIIRQGDVLLKLCNEKPKGQVTKHAELTVQLGEATGHHHTLYPSRVGINEELSDIPIFNVIEEFFNDKKRFITLDTEWLLRHQEHRELKIGPGTYEIIIEKEFDPFEDVIKAVID
jgi:hypothetical protein